MVTLSFSEVNCVGVADSLVFEFSVVNGTTEICVVSELAALDRCVDFTACVEETADETSKVAELVVSAVRLFSVDDSSGCFAVAELLVTDVGSIVEESALPVKLSGPVDDVLVTLAVEEMSVVDSAVFVGWNFGFDPPLLWALPAVAFEFIVLKGETITVDDDIGAEEEAEVNERLWPDKENPWLGTTEARLDEEEL
jgi:hypothetical protein